jgi:hypothetical protein
MDTFISLPSKGLSIPISSITHVTRSQPWFPVRDTVTGRVMNQLGDPLEVTIWFANNEEHHTFMGDDALKASLLFFIDGVKVTQYKGENLPLFTVVNTEKKVEHTSLDVPQSPTQDRRMVGTRYLPHHIGKPGGKLWCGTAYGMMKHFWESGDLDFHQFMKLMNSYVETQDGDQRYFDLLAPVADQEF